MKKYFILILLIISTSFLFPINLKNGYRFIKLNNSTLKIGYRNNMPFFIELKNFKLNKDENLHPEKILEELKYPLNIENTYDKFYLEREWESLSGIHLRFKANFNGIDVFNSYIDLHLDRNKNLYAIFEKVFKPETNKNVTLNEADCINISTSNFLKKYKKKKFVLLDYYDVYFIEKNILIPSVFVKIKDKNGPLTVKYVVSLIDGKILFYTSNIFHFDGNGNVFYPNPVNSLRNTSLRDMNDSNSAVPEIAYKEVVLKDISKDQNNNFILSGPNVNIKDIESPNILPPTSTDGNFLYKRNNKGFEAVMCYYWIDKACRYLNSLGFNIYPYPLNVDPHGVNGADQSHFTGGSTPYIAYGDGGVDDAEDADIILHEMGHSIQYFQNSSAFTSSGESGAIGEGFGDYWAFSNTYNISVANGFDPFCIGEWDSTSYSNTSPPCLRRVDSNKKYPDDMDGEVHDDGEIWSSCLREIFMKLGKEVTDSIVLEGQYLMPPSTNFRNGALSIIEADKNLYNGEHAAYICTVFYNRGILSQADCRSNGPFIEMYTPDFTELDGNGNSIADLGEIYKLNLSFYNSGNEDSGKVYIKVTPTSNSIEMLNDTTTIDNLPANGSITGANSPIVFKIGNSFPCGRKATFKIDVYNEGLEFIFNAELQVGNVSSSDIFSDDFENGGNSLWNTSVGSGSQSFGWQIKETPYNHSQNHSYFASDPPTPQDSYLILGPINLSTNKIYYLHFYHTYSFEAGYDGGVVEISIDGGNSFSDLGNYFIKNGYNMLISTDYSSPIGGRMAFSGGNLSTNLKESIIDLTNFCGSTIFIRFRATADQSNSGQGWYIDDVRIEEITSSCSSVSARGDLNGDGVVDSQDAVILKNELSDNLTLNSYLKDVSDINGDSRINIIDLITLLIQISR